MAWNDVYLTPDGGSSGSSLAPPRMSLPPAYDPAQSIVPGYAGDNTPPPKPKGVMDTSFTSLPSTANPDGGDEWGRITGAAYDAWQASQPPGDNNSWLHNPIGKLLGAGFGAPAALSAGAGQGVADAARGLGVPERAIRDIPFLSGAVTSVLPQWPEASGYARTAPPPAIPPSPMWRSPDAGPRYAPPQIVPGGGATVADVQRVQQAQAARAPSDPLQRPFVPLSQTDIEPPIAPQPQPVTTAAAAKAVAQKWYDMVDQNSGAAVNPQYATQGIEAAIQKLQPKGPMSGGLDPNNPINKIAVNLNAARNQPITLGDFDAHDKMLGDMASDAYRADRNYEGSTIQGIQADLRDHFENAGPNDVVGGQAGFDALDPARRARSQAYKMSDIEDMAYKAGLPGAPPGSMPTQIRGYLASDRSRNLTDMERAALTTAADRSPVAPVLGAVSNRIVTPLLGAWLGGGGGYAAAAGLGEGARSLAGTMARARVQKALGVLGQSVPDPPPPFSLPSGQP